MRAMPHNLKMLILYLLLLLPAIGNAQTPAQVPPLLGTWEGELVRGRDNMTLAFTFALVDGNYTAAITSSALGIFGMPAERVTVEGLKVNISVRQLDVDFYGTLRLSADGSAIERIDGDYYQSSEMVPVVLKFVTSPAF